MLKEGRPRLSEIPDGDALCDAYYLSPLPSAKLRADGTWRLFANSPIGESRLERIGLDICRESGVRPCTLYQWRSTVTCSMQDMGFRTEAVMRVTDHDTAVAAERYRKDQIDADRTSDIIMAYQGQLIASVYGVSAANSRPNPRAPPPPPSSELSAVCNLYMSLRCCAFRVRTMVAMLRLLCFVLLVSNSALCCLTAAAAAMVQCLLRRSRRSRAHRTGAPSRAHRPPLRARASRRSRPFPGAATRRAQRRAVGARSAERRCRRISTSRRRAGRTAAAPARRPFRACTTRQPTSRRTQLPAAAAAATRAHRTGAPSRALRRSLRVPLRTT